ncbi:DNA replication/repair protein RecF [Bacillaceae bacterium S4-13-58]
MHLAELSLKQYRNYEELTLPFDHKVNVFIGNNAQGKTNLMEAIYVLAFTKSHRTPRDKELIMWEREYGKIKGTITKRKQTFPLEVLLTTKGKRVKINHLEQRRLSDYIGAINVVMFAPEDLNLVKGSPSERRRFIDMELGQIQPTYLHHLAQYHRILKQRNHLLKSYQRKQALDLTMLSVLTDQLIEHAAQLVFRRFQFLELIRKWAFPIHRGISHGKEKLSIQYDPSIDVSDDMDMSTIVTVFEGKFKKIQKREVEQGSTLIGPHRDDLLFFVNDKNVQVYGSQGQQRTTALSLKLAEIELIKQEVGEYPILLLDDVLSELDDIRQSHLLNTIEGKVQTFVSTTSVEGIYHDTLKKADIFYVSDGKVTK